MNLNKKKILVTGGAGFIGSNLAMAIQTQYPEAEICVLDNFSTGSFENLTGFKGDVVCSDILENDLGKTFPELDLIFHQAAITSTIIERHEQHKVIHENVESFRKILNYCLDHKTHLIYASSSGVYGNSRPPMVVGQGETPANAYAFSKLVQDNIARKYFAQFDKKGQRLVGLRYFIAYGPNELAKVTEKSGSLVWKLYSTMKEGKRPVVFGDGEQKRDFVYTIDVASANLQSLDAKRSGIFNVGTGKATSVNELISILNNLLGTNLEIEYQKNPFAGSYQYHTEADIADTKEILGWEPKYTLEQGIKDYLK